MAKKNTRVAIIYDFDNTLSTQNIQEFKLLQDINSTPKKFWQSATKIAEDNGMNNILAYMYKIVQESKATATPITKKYLNSLGKSVIYFDGVKDWFNNINSYAKSKDISIEHYIISSGNKEIISGTCIAKYFKKIYACEFLYDEYGMPIWPAVAIDYTSKTQFLFRINKGCFDVHDDNTINEYQAEDERYIPFTNMIYIGDGFSDVPAMKLVKEKGGFSIAVYRNMSDKNIESSKKLLSQGRINVAVKADYSEGKGLSKLVKLFVDKIQANQSIQQLTDEIYKTNKKVK